jgi:23S rRNA (adenine2503-C2)-methyltransferase
MSLLKANLLFTVLAQQCTSILESHQDFEAAAAEDVKRNAVEMLGRTRHASLTHRASRAPLATLFLAFHHPASHWHHSFGHLRTSETLPLSRSQSTQSAVAGALAETTIMFDVAGNPAVVAQAPPVVNLLSLGEKELREVMVDWGFPSFRGTQIYDFIHKRGVTEFADMHNIPKTLKSKLVERATVGTLSVAVEQVSKDGTVKRAYALPDGQLIESVLMKYADGRRTACISSQVGCAMGCTFCATGQMGFKRSLSADEIFEQAMRFAAELKNKEGERLSNIVFMGMGEPLANYDNVLTAAKRINSDLGIGSRHITISTVGLAPQIRKLASEGLQFSLAVSLHESDNEARSDLMPINKKFPLEELLSACRDYQSITGRRITFEWALIAGENDNPSVANRLGSLLQGINCHVNIIPLNPTKGSDFRPASTAAMAEFIRVLEKGYGIEATPRVRRGLDIDAGCGQLTQKITDRTVVS